MGGERATVALARMRVEIAASIRRVAADITEDTGDAGEQVRRQLNEIADRYEAGTETHDDGAVLILMHAWVQQLTAGESRKETTDGIEG